MLEQRAKVIAIHASGIEVCARASTDCRLCAQGRGCGGGLISALLRKGQTSLIARPGAGSVAVGDPVQLRLSSGALLKAAALAYLGPLGAMFLVVLSLYVLGVRNDLWLAIGALIGLATGAMLARRHIEVHGLGRLLPTVEPLPDLKRTDR